MQFRIDYGGYRWMFFEDVAEDLNPDLRSEELRALSWRSAKKRAVWQPLRRAMEEPQLDVAVQAISDMTGEGFSSVRAKLLRRVAEMQVDQLRFSGNNSAAYPFRWALLLDPMLAYWQALNFVDYFAEEVRREDPRSDVRDGAEFVCEWASRARSVFSMPPSKGKLLSKGLLDEISVRENKRIYDAQWFLRHMGSIVAWGTIHVLSSQRLLLEHKDSSGIHISASERRFEELMKIATNALAMNTVGMSAETLRSVFYRSFQSASAYPPTHIVE